MPGTPGTDGCGFEQQLESSLKALRGGNEELIVFGAIVGVPPELVDAQARANVDFDHDASRAAYYAGILDDPRMQEREDPTREPGKCDLSPACNTSTGMAYPARRIVEVARDLGRNSIVQSICQADFGPALHAIVDTLGKRLDEACE